VKVFVICLLKTLGEHFTFTHDCLQVTFGPPSSVFSIQIICTLHYKIYCWIFSFIFQAFNPKILSCERSEYPWVFDELHYFRTFKTTK